MCGFECIRLVRTDLAEAEVDAGIVVVLRLILPFDHAVAEVEVVLLTALCHEVLPVLRTFLTIEVVGLVLLLLEHIDQRLGHFDLEGSTALGAHHGKRMTTGCGHDLILLDGVDAACLLIELAQIIHIVRRQTENKAVLAGIDDRSGFSGDLLAADKVLDILGNHDLHTVVLTDTLGKLEHEIQSDRELGVDENVRLIDHDHDLAVQTVLGVVITVLDDLVVHVLEHQEHLRIGDGRVAVGKEGLEVEDREVLIGGNGRGTIPDGRISAARCELGNVVHQRLQHGAQVGIIGTLEVLQHQVIQIVEDRVVLRTELRQVGLGGDVEVGIQALHQRVEVFERILLDIRQNLAEEFLQELQVCGKAVTAAAALGLIVVECGDDMERVQTPVGRIADIDDLAVEIVGKVGVLILRVKDENLSILGRHIGQDGLGAVGLTGTGLTDDDHVRINTLGVSAEKVNKDRNTVIITEPDTALVRNTGVDPGIHSRNGIGRDAVAILEQGVIAGDLRTDKAVDLREIHAVEPDTSLRPCTADCLFHVRNDRQRGMLHRLTILLCGADDIVHGDVDVDRKQHFVILLEGDEQAAEGLDMGFELDHLGVDAGLIELTTQLLERTVDRTDRLGALHRCHLDDDLGGRDGHHACKPCIADDRRVIHDTHLMCDDPIHDRSPGGKGHALRHCPGNVILGVKLIDLPLIEIEVVGVFQEDRKISVTLQTAHDQLALLESRQCILGLDQKLMLVDVEQRQVVERLNDLLLIAKLSDLVDAVILDLDTSLELLLGQQTLFIGTAQVFELVVLLVEVAVVENRTFDLDDICGIFHTQRTQDLTKAVLDRCVTAELAEEPEFDRIDLNDRAIVLAAIFNEAVRNTGEGHELLHAVFLSGSFLFFFFQVFFCSSRFLLSLLLFTPESVLFCIGKLLAFEEFLLLLAGFLLFQKVRNGGTAVGFIILFKELVPLFAGLLLLVHGKQMLVGVGTAEISGDRKIAQNAQCDHVVRTLIDTDEQKAADRRQSDDDIQPPRKGGKKHHEYQDERNQSDYDITDRDTTE